MKKTALASFGVVLMLGTAPLHAATLDDVMVELKSLRHGNTAIRKENAAIRHELTMLRRHEERQATRAPAVARGPAQNAQAAHAEAVAPATFAGGLSPHSTQAPLYANEIYDWGGFYAGLNAGYANGSAKNIVTALPAGNLSFSSANDGGVAGGQFGYNLQYDRVVLGIEADYQVASIGGEVNFAAVSNSSLKDFATIRGRIGYTFGRFLPSLPAASPPERSTTPTTCWPPPKPSTTRMFRRVGRRAAALNMDWGVAGAASLNISTQTWATTTT